VHLVTGGAGFIGSHLCDALLASGDHVICVDNLVGTRGSMKNIDHLLTHGRFEFINESLVTWAPTADLSGVDTVFHQAASKNTVSIADPELDLMVNALGTQRMLRAAVRGRVRKFVHGSTGSVFGALQDYQDEDHPKNPLSFYGVSKLAAESYCRVVGDMYGLDYTVFRYYHVIGPRQDDSDSGGVVPIFVKRCEEGRDLTIYGTGRQSRSFTSVFDVVAANLMASYTPRASRQFFNCASGIRVTIQELADFVIAEMESDVGIGYEDFRPGDIVDFNVDNAKIKSLGMTFNRDWRGVVRGVIESRGSRPTRHLAHAMGPKDDL
jgi:UDP-glucose 4-epimerase